jgi:[ribosomal protein S18]-alanine N-acetyltransferase
MNITYTKIDNDNGDTPPFSREQIAGFLYEQLGPYRDQKKAILKCIGYAYGDKPGQDGFLLIAHQDNEISGAVIINQTNMGDYIPENILVYIAVHKKTRGMGIGKELMKRVIKSTDGDIALHVEPDNPARYLYEKLDFTNKYLEMRLTKQ